MANSEFGDIILVPFPFTDQTTTKKHPAAMSTLTPFRLQLLADTLDHLLEKWTPSLTQ